MNSLIHEKRYHQLLGDITGLCENARSVPQLPTSQQRASSPPQRLRRC